MKVRKLVWPMFLVCVVGTAFLPACEEKNEEEGGAAADGKPAAEGKATAGGETTGGAAAPAEKKEAPPAPKPEDVCNNLVTAVKAKDEAKVLALSSANTATALTPEAKEYLMAQLGAATCGASKVEGAGATVALTGGEAPQDAPFVKDGTDWKFDGAAYLTKYPPPDKSKNAKGKAAKGKEKDHGKGKAKGKGKHKH